MKKTRVIGLILFVCVMVVVRSVFAVEQRTIILTTLENVAIIESGENAKVFGSSQVANYVTIEVGAVATLVNFPRSNFITIQSDARLFSVSRSGATVTFEDSNGTMVKLSATKESQSIYFDNAQMELYIANNNVWLDNLLVTKSKTACVPVEFPEGIENVIEIQDDYQVVNLKVDGGYVNGFFLDGRPCSLVLSEIESIVMMSDRVGYGSSCAIAKVGFNGVAIIRNTPNNDRAIWALKLTNGAEAYLNFSATSFIGKDVLILEDIGRIEYGNYETNSIEFIKETNQLRIDFGSNVISGFVSRVNPDDIVSMQWHSNETGWLENVTIEAELEQDDEEKYYVELNGMPDSDNGLITAKLKDGSLVWLEVPGNWIYTNANVTNTGGDVRISY